MRFVKSQEDLRFSDQTNFSNEQEAIFTVSYFANFVTSLRLTIRCLEPHSFYGHIISEMNHLIQLIFNEKNRWITALSEVENV